jgi:hypothetical protein
MTKITQAQSLERWDALPQILREALYSDVNSGFLWTTCEAEHIPDEKIYTVSGIVGYVLMGFLHPEDMAAEVAEALNIDRRIADSIATAINQRIFAPIRQDIDKVYGPPGSENIGPKIFQEIKPATVSASASATSLPKPASLPAKGWSGIPTIIASVPVVAPPPKSVGEFERLAATKIPVDGKGSVGPGLRQDDKAAAPATTPAPTIIQSAVGAPKPIQNAPDFRSPSIAQNIMGGMKGSVPLPPRPAVIEAGQTTSQKAWTPASAGATEKNAPKVLHYGEFTSSLPATMPMTAMNKPPIAESGRKLTEITPAAMPAIKPAAMPIPMPPTITPTLDSRLRGNDTALVPPKPPAMPAAQMPIPKPPAPNTAKPIVKDCLDGK